MDVSGRCLLLVLLAGCGTLPTPPARPLSRDLEAPPGLRADLPAPPSIRPGDTLTCSLGVDPHRTYSGLPVTATGGLHVPGLGQFQVAGLTVPEAEALLLARAREEDKDARVTLRQARRGGQRVTVLGAVQRQGAFPIGDAARVADALAAAGGPLSVASGGGGAPVPLANLSRAQVMRQGKPLPISLELALAGDPAHNVLLHPGDHIHVPMRDRPRVSVFGQVRSPAVVAHWHGMRLTEALALVGGLTPDGDRSDIRLVRGSLAQPAVYSASLDAIIEGKSSDVALAPGDVLFVTDHWLEDVREVLRLVVPVVAVASTALLISLVSSP